MSIIRIIVTGRLSTDVALREHNGSKFATFGLVGDSELKDQDGKQTPMFFDVVVNSPSTAQACANHLGKGMQTVVMGRLSQPSYKDKEGNDRTKLRISALDVDFVGGKPKAKTTDELPI